ncbi:phospholipid carrier-dependent glycosyltransferase [Chloroflexales bacterium ZM16-3]|nr:phospholipid carrier-dependent glycosyltransferase [Chloroflexales bacterium ZM16-3]
MQKVKGKRQKVNEALAFYLLPFTLFLLGLALRLLAWRWREFYPLGGDEREYLDQAIWLLRDHQYVELRLMRPPLYPVFLAGCIYFFDSLVQNLRLVQALISAATVPLVYLLAREVARRSGVESRGPALLAAALCALSYTLAANATELLTEALFLFGLTAALWLLLRAGRTGRLAEGALAGLIIGALCLLRSVALPLLPLGAVWLALNATGKRQKVKDWLRAAAPQVCLFTFTCCLILLPWSARNYVAYGGLILIDTTGAENLWLDNDPAGREAVKAQLYAMGDDRLARQQLSMQRGVAAISGDPARFAAKAWGELKKLFALEFSDDLLARPAIWVPQTEVWARLILGDGVWLVVLGAGGWGLGVGGRESGVGSRSFWARILGVIASPAGLLLPWALYVGLTTVLFHVELRYRLPLYPALLPFAGLALAGAGGWVLGGRGRWPMVAGGLAVAVCLGMTLLHANYPALAWWLGWKHLDLARAEAALGRSDVAAARAAAGGALALDDGSALARVALARADVLAGDEAGAMTQLDAAIGALPAHPYAHLLRGDLLRQRGDVAAARADLAFETSSLEDLQVWSWGRFTSEPPSRIDLGDGLDLGFIRGFHSVAPGEVGFRWTRGEAQLRLMAPAGATELRIRAASGRPDGSPCALRVTVDGRDLGSLQISADGGGYVALLPARFPTARIVVVGLRSDTFMPRDFDRASADGRRLGVRVVGVEVGP